MGIPNKEQALALAAAAVGVVIVTSAAFAAELPVAVVVEVAEEEVVKPEALPKTLPMFEVEEFQLACHVVVDKLPVTLANRTVRRLVVRVGEVPVDRPVLLFPRTASQQRHKRCTRIGESADIPLRLCQPQGLSQVR